MEDKTEQSRIDWRLLGRHTHYATGQPRPALRGLIYGIVAIGGLPTILLAPLQILQQHMALTTWAVYCVGAVFHLVPFSSHAMYQRVLACDYAAISTAFTAHAALWRGACFRQDLLLQLSLCCTVLIVGTTAYCFARRRDPQRHFRGLRATCGLVQVLALARVQAAAIALPWLRGALLSLQLGGFTYFALCAQINAPLHTTALTLPGVWEGHDNFHVIALVVHCLQVYGAGLLRRP